MSDLFQAICTIPSNVGVVLQGGKGMCTERMLDTIVNVARKQALMVQRNGSEMAHYYPPMLELAFLGRSRIGQSTATKQMASETQRLQTNDDEY